MSFDVDTALFMSVTVFLKVIYHENVVEDRLQLTMSVDVSITMTSMSLRDYEHRNQAKNKGHSVPLSRYNTEATTIRIVLHLTAAPFNVMEHPSMSKRIKNLNYMINIKVAKFVCYVKQYFLFCNLRQFRK